MAPLISLAYLAFLNTRSTFIGTSTRRLSKTSSIMASMEALSSLPPLNQSDGSAINKDKLSDIFKGKRVALYFAAGWCPMCTRFEPSLMKFQSAAASNGKDVEIIYVPSDQNKDAVIKRTIEMEMMSVPFGEEADEIKAKYKIWSGSECGKLGTDRRSGVPALVVLDSKNGSELAFIDAESRKVCICSVLSYEFVCSICSLNFLYKPNALT